MFLGHFGSGAKKLQPSVSLGTLFLATQLADLVWPTLLLLLGVERVRIVPHFTATNAFDFTYYSFTHGSNIGRSKVELQNACCSTFNPLSNWQQVKVISSQLACYLGKRLERIDYILSSRS